MDITKYVDDIDKIICDVSLKSDLTEDDKNELVNLVAYTINQYDKSIDLDTIEFIVDYIIVSKCDKYYKYNSTPKEDNNTESERKDQADFKEKSTEKSTEK